MMSTVCRHHIDVIIRPVDLPQKPPATKKPQPTHVFAHADDMDGPKDPANAAASAARRKDPTAKAHDEARREVKDLLDRRGNGEPTAALRKRKGVYGCDIMRQKAPDHDHHLKDEAYCRELIRHNPA